MSGLDGLFVLSISTSKRSLIIILADNTIKVIKPETRNCGEIMFCQDRPEVHPPAKKRIMVGIILLPLMRWYIDWPFLRKGAVLYFKC
jgi:hypothetical protein